MPLEDLRAYGMRKIHRRQANGLGDVTPGGVVDPNTDGNTGNNGNNGNTGATSKNNNGGTSANNDGGTNVNDDGDGNGDGVNAGGSNSVTGTGSATITNTVLSTTTTTSVVSTTSTTSSQTSTSTTTTSSVPSTTSQAPTTTSTSSTSASSTTSVSVAAPTTAKHAASTSTTFSVQSRTFNTDSWVSTTTLGPSGTALSATSTGPGVGSIIGIVGGGLIGLVCLAAVVGFIIRRASHRKDRFNRNKFVRNSTVLPDDDFHEKPQMGTKNALALARANNGFLDEPSSMPRPPTMIERRTQPGASFNPGEVVQGANNGHYGNEHAYYNNGYDYNYNQYTHPYVAEGAAGRQAELTREPSHREQGQGNGYEQQDDTADAYADMGDESYNPDGSAHQSVTPYQQEQYAEITRQLNLDGAAPAATQTAGKQPAGGKSNASVSRALSTTYSSLNPEKPSKTYTDPRHGDRSGTPTDRNPQQTYFPPTSSNESSPPANYKPAGRLRAVPTRAAHVSNTDEEAV